MLLALALAHQRGREIAEQEQVDKGFSPIAKEGLGVAVQVLFKGRKPVSSDTPPIKD